MHSLKQLSQLGIHLHIAMISKICTLVAFFLHNNYMGNCNMVSNEAALRSLTAFVVLMAGATAYSSRHAQPQARSNSGDSDCEHSHDSAVPEQPSLQEDLASLYRNSRRGVSPLQSRRCVSPVAGTPFGRFEVPLRCSCTASQALWSTLSSPLVSSICCLQG